MCRGPKALARSKRPHQHAHKESSHRRRGNQRLPWLGIRAFAQAQHPTILDHRGVLQQLFINEPGHPLSLKPIPLEVRRDIGSAGWKPEGTQSTRTTKLEHTRRLASPRRTDCCALSTLPGALPRPGTVAPQAADSGIAASEPPQNGLPKTPKNLPFSETVRHGPRRRITPALAPPTTVPTKPGQTCAGPIQSTRPAYSQQAHAMALLPWPVKQPGSPRVPQGYTQPTPR